MNDAKIDKDNWRQSRLRFVLNAIVLIGSILFVMDRDQASFSWL